MKWAFIDYENVGSLGRVDLACYERVIVFLGARQPRLDFNDRKYDKPINLVVIQLKATHPNNLDFHLAYYLGKFNSEAPTGVTFDVVTNDTGFVPLIAHIKKGGRPCKQVNVVLESVHDDKFIDSFKTLPKNLLPRKVVSLRNYIDSHCNFKGNEVAIQNRFNQLVNANFVKVSGEDIEYPE